MLTVAIIEDDSRDLLRLESALTRYEREEGEDFRITKFADAEKFLTGYKPVYDIVFMDIELGGVMDGIAAARKMRLYDESVALLFVTNMAQYAIKGYEVSALDYFVKPVAYYDLKMRLDRIRRTLKKSVTTLSVSIDGGTKRLPADEIYYIEVLNHTLEYHTKSGVYACRASSIRELEKRLEGDGFARCSVSYLVNLKFCSEIKGSSIVVGGDELKITRGKRKEFVYKLAAVLNGGGGLKKCLLSPGFSENFISSLRSYSARCWRESSCPAVLISFCASPCASRW